jgi:hypothetical protein
MPSIVRSVAVVVPSGDVEELFVRTISVVAHGEVARAVFCRQRFVLASSRLRARTVPSELLYSTGMSKCG